MPRGRRTTEVFTMSFLDCICCGFGAVVLVYVIISATAGVTRVHQDDDLKGEVNKLEEQVLEGYKNLVVLRNTMQKTTSQSSQASGRIAQILSELDKTRVELSRYTGDTMSQQEHINQLRSDIRALEEGNRRLEAGAKENTATGQNVRAFKGQGNRLYLTGVTITGKHVLVLIDISASMLDETLVNVLRMRNLPDVQKMLAPKWQRAVATVDWLTTQIPPDSEFQVYAFNTEAHSVVEGSDGKWLKAVDPRPLNAAVQRLKHMFPHDGTSLINAFNAAKTLDPLPDQIVLVTDGLPTQGATPPALRKAVDVEQRAKLFDQSLSALPPKVPVSTILLPMEGDLPAPSRFWRLARETGGVFMEPSKDWP
jgi:hypothetical protein